MCAYICACVRVYMPAWVRAYLCVCLHAFVSVRACMCACERLCVCEGVLRVCVCAHTVLPSQHCSSVMSQLTHMHAQMHTVWTPEQ